MIWQDVSSLIALDGDTLYWRDFGDVVAAAEANLQITSGAAPNQALGTSCKRLRIDRIKAVEWVPAVRTLIVKFAWWRDPWRIVFENSLTGESVFAELGARLRGDHAPSEERVGPNDLALDPKFGLPALLAVVGVIALVGGAVEGPGQAVLMGPAARFQVLANIGGEIGPTAAMAIGGLLLLIGIAALVYWHRTRPTKFVIRRAAKH